MNKKQFAVVFLLLFFGIMGSFRADMALPPTHILVTYNNAPISGNFTSTELVCLNTSYIPSNSTSTYIDVNQYDSARNCYWQPSPDVSGGFCTDSICAFYSFPPEDFKMAFALAGKLYVTNDVLRSNYTFDYVAHVYSNGSATLGVAGTIPNPPINPQEILIIAAAALASAVIEAFVSLLYVRWRKIKDKGRVPLIAGLANIISVPVVWLVFIYFLGALGFVIGEVFAVLFDGYFAYYFNKKAITLKSALAMSLIMNVVSVIVGIFLVIAFFGFF